MDLSSYFCQITHLGGVQRCCLASIVWEAAEGSHKYQECIEMGGPPLVGLWSEGAQRGALFPEFSSQWIESV